MGILNLNKYNIERKYRMSKKRNVVSWALGAISLFCCVMIVIIFISIGNLKSNLLLSLKEIDNIETRMYDLVFSLNAGFGKKIEDMQSGDVGWIAGITRVGTNEYVFDGTMVGVLYSKETPIKITKELDNFTVDFSSVKEEDRESRIHYLKNPVLQQWDQISSFYNDVRLLTF